MIFRNHVLRSQAPNRHMRMVDACAASLHPPIVYPAALMARHKPAAQGLLDHLFWGGCGTRGVGQVRVHRRAVIATVSLLRRR